MIALEDKIRIPAQPDYYYELPTWFTNLLIYDYKWNTREAKSDWIISLDNNTSRTKHTKRTKSILFAVVRFLGHR